MPNGKEETPLSGNSLREVIPGDPRIILWKAKMQGLWAIKEEADRSFRKAVLAGLMVVLSIALPWFAFLIWLCNKLNI